MSLSISALASSQLLTTQDFLMTYKRSPAGNRSSSQGSPEKEADILRSAEEFLHTNLCNPVAVADIAAAAGAQGSGFAAVVSQQTCRHPNAGIAQFTHRSRARHYPAWRCFFCQRRGRATPILQPQPFFNVPPQDSQLHSLAGHMATPTRRCGHPTGPGSIIGCALVKKIVKMRNDRILIDKYHGISRRFVGNGNFIR